MPNGGDGVVVGAGGVDATHATVGGTSAGTSNLISGNGGAGVDFETPFCVLQNSLIGTNLAGSAAVPNGGDGVRVFFDAPGTTVGGTSAATSNLISGNTGAGVDILSSSNVVEGNLIGTTKNGAAVHWEIRPVASWSVLEMRLAMWLDCRPASLAAVI